MDVVKDLVKSCPKLKLLIVGDGPDMEEYQEYIQNEKLQEHIIMTGKAKWEDMPYYYHLANIFLTASFQSSALFSTASNASFKLAANEIFFSLCLIKSSIFFVFSSN